MAFYEIAATLIPVLLLGGVVVEAVKPPPEDTANPTVKTGREEGGDTNFKDRMMAHQIPLVGVMVICSRSSRSMQS